jgi:hypothetical protein
MGRARNTEMPNLFIIGAAKCGTTSLHYYLDLHPEISMSKVKEPKYFLGPIPSSPRRLRVTSRESYLDLFEPGVPVRGEASVAYSVSPCLRGVAERIANETPDARIVYMVRDPVERIVSGMRLRVALGHLPPPNRSDTGAFWSGVLGDLDPGTNDIVARSLYMSQIREYLEHFPAESIMVIDHRGLLDDRIPTLERVFDFLGVDARFRHPRFEVERNSGSTVATGGLNRRLRTSGTARKASMLLPEPVRKRAIGMARRFTGRRIEIPEMPQELRGRLIALFGPEVEDLREFTGQKFDGWSV